MSEIKPAVYYAKSDQIGLIRRMLIDIVDGTVLLLVWLLFLPVILMFNVAPERFAFALMMTIIVTGFAYLVVLKRVARTLGYVVGNAQVVNLFGQKPSIVSLMIRALFVSIGPLNSLMDLIWLSSDPHRQAIRDKISRSYVIRRGSQPAGQGHIRYVRLDLLGYQLLLPEVTRD